MITRVFHPYTEWEDWKAGVWSTVPPSKKHTLLKKAINFTGNSAIYGSFMNRVIVEWPTTCEHHLSDRGSNRKAWIGHAACCLAIQCPEDITRAAWGYLNQEQQDAANLEAEKAIAIWESQYSF